MNAVRRPFLLATAVLGGSATVVLASLGVGGTFAAFTDVETTPVQSVSVGSWEPPPPDECSDVLGTEFNIIYGTPGDDRITGTNKRDLIYGGAGDDVLLGGSQDDCLVGGEDDDELDGQNGKDVLIGGPGEDVLAGDNGKDVLYGDPDDDELDGDNGPDDLDGGDGVDECDGGAAPDEETTCETEGGADGA